MEEAILHIKVDSIFVNPEIKGTITGMMREIMNMSGIFVKLVLILILRLVVKNLAYLWILILERILYFEIKIKVWVEVVKGTNLSVITAVTKGFMILGDLEDGHGFGYGVDARGTRYHGD
ncbi:MAG: hypothetical protein ACLUDU_04585 [Butyricimonas faecihominis]